VFKDETDDLGRQSADSVEFAVPIRCQFIQGLQLNPPEHEVGGYLRTLLSYRVLASLRARHARHDRLPDPTGRTHQTPDPDRSDRITVEERRVALGSRIPERPGIPVRVNSEADVRMRVRECKHRFIDRTPLIW
jgi:hypothetical protein